MTVSMVPNKSNKIKVACHQLMSKAELTICDVASVVGLLVASFPGVTYGPLFYRALESDKIEALKYSARNLDGPIHLHLAQTIYTSVANTSAHIHCTVGLSTST